MNKKGKIPYSETLLNSCHWRSFPIYFRLFYPVYQVCWGHLPAARVRLCRRARRPVWRLRQAGQCHGAHQPALQTVRQAPGGEREQSLLPGSASGKTLLKWQLVYMVNNVDVIELYLLQVSLYSKIKVFENLLILSWVLYCRYIGRCIEVICGLPPIW